MIWIFFWIIFFCFLFFCCCFVLLLRSRSRLDDGWLWAVRRFSDQPCCCSICVFECLWVFQAEAWWCTDCWVHWAVVFSRQHALLSACLCVLSAVIRCTVYMCVCVWGGCLCERAWVCVSAMQILPVYFFLIWTACSHCHCRFPFELSQRG